MAVDYVLGLQDPGAVLDVAGGKGAALARLARAGLPIPGGFVVTTDAYRRFVFENDLEPMIARALDGVDPGRPSDDLDRASEAIGEAFLQATVPTCVTDSIVRAYTALPAGTSSKELPAVAVRSSATAEDLPGASFAGQHESYLNVRGTAAVIRAVRCCWASLWTARAIAYRVRQGTGQGDGPQDLALAVVVQDMVAADAAGIMFTANPISGRRDETVINASWGLGEAIVGGRVVPDVLVVDSATARVKRADVADKAVMTVRGESGTRDVPVPDELRRIRTLDDGQISCLVDLGRRVQRLSGAPQDVEWCLSGERIILVQSRPITTLFPLPEPRPAPGAGPRIYLGVTVALQGITEPLTPMGTEMFRLLLVGMVDGLRGRPTDRYPSWLTIAAQRLYLDVTALLADRRVGRRYLRGLSAKDPVAHEALTYLARRDLTGIGDRELRLPWRLPLVILPRLVGPAAVSFVAPALGRRRGLMVGRRRYDSLAERARGLTGPTERLQFIEDAARTYYWPLMFQVAYCATGMQGSELVPRLLQRWLGHGELAQPVLQSLPFNPTTEMGQALLRGAVRLRSEGAEPTVQHPVVQELLARYGHRAVREIDVGLPRWHEDPEYLLELLRGYVGRDDLRERLRVFDEAPGRADLAARQVVTEVRRRKGLVRALLVGHLMRCVRAAGGLREQPKFDLVRGLDLLRQVLWDVGRDLVRQGRLDDPDDVYYLTFADLANSGDLRASAAAARSEFGRELDRAAIPRVITSVGECFYSAPGSVGDERVLRGTPISPGAYEGVARVIADPRGGGLRRGEILVARSTDPSWTPLFLNAGAVVMETGGPISHGAIVAREYGIPAVAGVGEVTARVRTGQRLSVNGSTGEVVLLDEARGPAQ